MLSLASTLAAITPTPTPTSTPTAASTVSPLLPAIIGAVVAILVAAGTQLWLDSRARRQTREDRLDAAIASLMTAIGDELGGQPTAQLHGVIASAYAARAWTLRSGFQGFAAAQEQFVRQARRQRSSGNLAEVAVQLTAVTLACSKWINDPQCFDRSRRPVTTEQVAAEVRASPPTS